MSISFKSLKSPKLGMLDTITFGKLRGCRVCDVITDYHDYLAWLMQNKLAAFTDEVLQSIEDVKTTAMWEQHKKEEIDPWFNDDPWFDDIPF